MIVILRRNWTEFQGEGFIANGSLLHAHFSLGQSQSFGEKGNLERGKG